jgi:hypothetical protein
MGLSEPMTEIRKGELCGKLQMLIEELLPLCTLMPTTFFQVVQMALSVFGQEQTGSY